MIRCSRCQRDTAEDRSYVNKGRVYCEDCLMDIGLSIKECDPWATYTDTSARRRHGQTGAAGLSEIEAKIYEFGKSQGRATREEVMKNLGLSERELNSQLIGLMHSELIKERSEGSQM